MHQHFIRQATSALPHAPTSSALHHLYLALPSPPPLSLTRAQYIYNSSNPGQAACASAPILAFAGVTAFSLSSLTSASSSLLFATLQSLAAGCVAAVLISVLVERQLGPLLGDFCEIPGKVPIQRVGSAKGPMGTQLRIVYGVFGYLQVSGEKNTVQHIVFPVPSPVSAACVEMILHLLPDCEVLTVCLPFTISW